MMWHKQMTIAAPETNQTLLWVVDVPSEIRGVQWALYGNPQQRTMLLEGNLTVEDVNGHRLADEVPLFSRFRLHLDKDEADKPPHEYEGLNVTLGWFIWDTPAPLLRGSRVSVSIHIPMPVGGRIVVHPLICGHTGDDGRYPETPYPSAFNR